MKVLSLPPVSASCNSAPTSTSPNANQQQSIPSPNHSILIARRRSLLLASASGILAASPFLVSTATAASSPPVASSSSEIQQNYNKYAQTYDNLDGGTFAEALGFPEQRKSLLQAARGDVLECGVGTGLNLQFYTLSNLKSFTAIDISPGMLANAQQKAATLNFPSSSTALLQADVAALPFADDSFDTVIDTFSMCVFPDPAAALRSMARVLRPQGQLLLLEHSRSKFALLGAYQDLTSAPVAAMGKGCVWNQDVVRLVQEAGFRIDVVQPHLGDLVLSLRAVKKI